MRPMLNPGLRRVWRDPSTVQFGVDVPEPVVLQGVDDSTAALLDRLDGSMSSAAFVQRAVQDGHEAAAVSKLLRELTQSGAVIDAATWPGGRALTVAARARLVPDLAAAALTEFAHGPADRCEQLASTSLTIHGVGRLGAVLGTLLSASGIGRIHVVDDRTVRPEDVCVGGFTSDDLGQPRASVTHHLAAWRSVGDVPSQRDLAVVTNAVDSRQVAQVLTAAGTPHLVVTSAEGVGRVGPFVMPGQSSCLRCHDLTRTDHDPGWPRVVVQLGDSADQVACDSNLTLATGAIAALHVISWLSTGQPPSLNGVLELQLPHGRSHQQSVPIHPACGCAWPITGLQDTMAG